MHRILLSILAALLLTPMAATGKCIANATESKSSLQNDDSLRIERDIAYRNGDSKSWRLDMAMPASKSSKSRPALP